MPSILVGKNHIERNFSEDPVFMYIILLRNKFTALKIHVLSVTCVPHKHVARNVFIHNSTDFFKKDLITANETHRMYIPHLLMCLYERLKNVEDLVHVCSR